MYSVTKLTYKSDDYSGVRMVGFTFSFVNVSFVYKKFEQISVFINLYTCV